MDTLFEGLIEQLRTSGRFADSTLLEIVHLAMLDAHKKTVSEETRGLLRLHHNARFQELSIMELECCLKVVREEAENNFYGQRYEFEQVLDSLLEQQTLMQKKLEELEIIIAGKDRELTRREQNEIKHKLSFEMIGNEVEKAVKEYVKNNSTKQSRVLNLEKDDHGMIDRLKSSIEQELSKIELKLKNCRDIFTGKLQKVKQDSVNGVIDLENDGINQLHSFYNIAHLVIGYEEVISDVSILKEDIKSSFQMIESSIFSTKLEEYQLQMCMEREILNLFMKNIIGEAQCKNCELGLIGVTPADKTKKLQSAKGNPEEANALRAEIDKVVFSSTIKEWNEERNAIDVYHSLRGHIDNVIFGERIKDLSEFCSSCSTSTHSNENGDKVIVSSIINDCANAIEAIELENSLRDDIHCVVISNIMKDSIKFSSSIASECGKNKFSFDEVRWKTINEEALIENNTAFSKLSASFLGAEFKIRCKLNANNERLDDLNQQLDAMKNEIILLKRKELLYKQAFLRRCYDLQTAEAEVDLLGDEVEFLLSLIKRSYEVLYHQIPEVQYRPEVVEVVNLLKREVEV